MLIFLAWPAMLINSALVALLAIAAWYDLKSCRIPNFISLPGVVLGILLNAIAPAGLGFFAALGGAAAGLLLPLPLYALRILGAGDVKLFAVIGAFLGARDLLGAVLAILVAGGMLAVLAAWAGGSAALLRENITRMMYQVLASLQLRSPSAIAAPSRRSGQLPYAVPMLLGTVAYLAIAP